MSLPYNIMSKKNRKKNLKMSNIISVLFLTKKIGFCNQIGFLVMLAFQGRKIQLICDYVLLLRDSISNLFFNFNIGFAGNTYSFEIYENILLQYMLLCMWDRILK